jgi:hypothetical protein
MVSGCLVDVGLTQIQQKATELALPVCKNAIKCEILKFIARNLYNEAVASSCKRFRKATP